MYIKWRSITVLLSYNAKIYNYGMTHHMSVSQKVHSDKNKMLQMLLKNDIFMSNSVYKKEVKWYIVALGKK